MKSTIVIANPAAGRLSSIEELYDALDLLPDHVLHETREGEDPAKIARNAIEDGATTVIAAGGDGTLHAVVCGVEASRRDVTVGLIPLGTGNDLARTLQLPMDLESAVAVIANRHTRAIDLVHVDAPSGKRCCVNASAGGFAGIVDEKLQHNKTGWLGPLAYLGSALEALLEVPVYDFTLELDGNAPIHLTGCNIVVANGRSVAGGVVVAPEALVDDGCIDVAVFRATTPTELALMVPKLLAGTPLAPEQIFYARCSKLTVATSPAATFNSDGELIGEGPIHYDVRHRGLRFLAP